jgi:hypothetical protein
MRKSFILSLILTITILFTDCSKFSQEEVSVLSDSTLIVASELDSILKASDSIAFSVKHTAHQTDSAIKITIKKFIYNNKMLSEKSLMVNTVIVRDTVFIIETESKNFWGKTVKSRKIYNKKGIADSSSVLFVQDSVSVQVDSSATK